MKNRLISIILILAMTMCMLPAFNVVAQDTNDITELLCENFDSYTIEQTVAGQGNWSITNSSLKGNLAQIVNDPQQDSSNDKVLDIEVVKDRDTKDNRYAKLTMSKSTGNKKYMMITHKVRFTQGVVSSIFYVYGNFKSGSSSVNGKPILQISYDLKNKVITQVTDGGNINLATDVSYTTDKWVDMKYVVDLNSNTFDAYMDNKKINGQAIPTYFDDAGYKISDVTSVQAGSIRWNNTPAHIYMDDIVITTFDNPESAGLDSRITAIKNSLTSYTLTGQKYVTENFKVNIPGLWEDDTLSIESSDSAFSYDAETKNVTITRQDEDKIVDVTVSVTPKDGIGFTKKLKVYILRKAYICMYEGMNYPELAGQSVSKANGWSVQLEDNNADTTGVLQKITASPDDSTDYVLNTNVIRYRDPNVYDNQYALYDCNAPTGTDMTIQANFKFADTSANQFIWYVTGGVKAPGSSESKATNLIQITFNRSNNTIVMNRGSEIVTICSETLPANEWFNAKIVLDSETNTFDFYIDNVKKNTEPVKVAANSDKTDIQGLVTIITQMSFGAFRKSARAGNMYVDDIMVSVNTQDVASVEMANMKWPTTLKANDELPSTGIFKDTRITWSCADDGILANSNKIANIVGFGSTTAKLTATITAGGISGTKEFNVNIYKAPPYTINNLEFETSDGNVSYVPAKGGKIKKLSVTRYSQDADDNATAIVAVYAENGTLLKVAEPKAVTASGNLTYDTQLDDVDGMYAKAYIWNMKNYEPLAYNYSTNVDGTVTVYTMGDSIMQTYGTTSAKEQDNTITGWGQVLGLGFDDSKVVISNHGRAGRSVRSFYNEGYWDRFYKDIKPGDYLIIMFAHNDQNTKNNDRYVPLEEAHRLPTTAQVPEMFKDAKTYEQWLRDYAEAARMKGAHVVFATSIYRCRFENDGTKPINGHQGYPEAMIATANEISAPVLDVHTRSGEWLETLGKEKALEYYMFSIDGSDTTHVRYDGAVEIANMAIGEMKRIGLPIAKYATSVPKAQRD